MGNLSRKANGLTVLDLIGQTPTVPLRRLTGVHQATVLAKLEAFNPGGSVKDRIAQAMVLEAERQGQLTPGAVIIEATSGNTGIGLAVVAAARGYRLVLVMPDTMSEERQNLLRIYGVEVHLTPGIEGMGGAIAQSEKLLAENKDWFMPRQFENPANPAIHRVTTAREILEQVEGEIHAFVAGVGTGGTITGVGEVLKEVYPDIRLIAVEPRSSAVLSGRPAGPHRIQGIGAGFIPRVLRQDLLDEVITVSDHDAYHTTHELARQEGILAGISAGAAVWGALQIAKRLGPGKQVVTILPDTGERYLSMAPYFKLNVKKN